MIINQNKKLQILEPLVLIIVTLLSPFIAFGVAPNPVDLKCEYLENPIGIDAGQPRFTWRLKDDRRGAKQTAYQIFIGTDSLHVVHNDGNVWNSGKVSSNNNLIVFQGKPLQPYTKYFWRVDVWDKNGERLTASEVTTFETGMMQVKNWKGNWITDVQDIDLKPAPYFRKVFQTNKKIKTARAYIAVGGLFELS
ncbi:MAG: alpha-rhamnosidase, partial [Sphingobacteriaceae bacterium]